MKDPNSEGKDRLIEALRRLLAKTEEVQSKIKADNAAIEFNIRKLAPISSEEGQNFELLSKKNQEKLEKMRKLEFGLEKLDWKNWKIGLEKLDWKIGLENWTGKIGLENWIGKLDWKIGLEKLRKLREIVRNWEN